MAHQHGSGFSIDMYAFHSKLKHINPEFKLICALITLILTIIFNDPYVSAYVLLTMFFISVQLGKMDFKEYLSILLGPLSFIIVASIGIALGFSFEALGDYHIKIGNLYIYTSKEQLIETAKLIIKVLACVSVMQSLILSTMPYEIINALRNMHVPKLIIELMNLIYRFIFILIESYMNMHNSALSRLGYHNLKASYKSFGNIASNILVVSLKKANAYYTSMEARCFDGDLNFLQEEKKLDKKHLFTAILFILSMFAIWFISSKLDFLYAL
jgi:cobalt ABC transporter, permease protein cbiQ